MSEPQLAHSAENEPLSASSLPFIVFAIFRHLSAGRQRSILPVMGLMLVGALAELFNLGALVAFLTMISDPSRIGAIGGIGSLLAALGADSPTRLIYFATALFATAILAAMAIRVALLRMTLSFVFGIAYELSARLYQDTLYQDYPYHTQRNSSEIISVINKAQLVTEQVILPSMQAVVAAVLAIFIIGGLIWIDPGIALIAGALLATIYLITSGLSRARLQRASNVQAKAQGARVQAMQEGLGGIRDVLLDRSQPVFIEVYERAEAEFRDARFAAQFAAQSPRFIVEGLGMIVVAAVACVLSAGPEGLIGAIPVLGALALGAQRLLPLLQTIYVAWAMSNASRQLLTDLLDMLSRPRPPQLEDTDLSFRETLRFDHVSYRYSGAAHAAISDVSLVIPRGARIGIAGRTGSGKSTLMDLIIGLLEPTDGEIHVDGTVLTPRNRNAWQQNIAHVPQSIFLSDASIAENIAFGVRPADIDQDRVRRAAEQAELGEVIAALPNGYDTRVGERGIQLSGGQRQRIGIARALYKQATLLVFDEATSALDNDTEAAVMRAVNRLDRKLTVLIIAHRLSTLEGCDEVIRLEGGRVVKSAAASRFAVDAELS